MTPKSQQAKQAREALAPWPASPTDYGYLLGQAQGHAEWGRPCDPHLESAAERGGDPYARGYMAGRQAASRGEPSPVLPILNG